ncbi:exported hypothetical protein [Candidatus Xenohaliotis californiensis]|uniref:Lipoprotein n=1 Tax=Candidatus Xenohaliotis californiensis TaxID=84677 RepID=A0ABP0ETE5_9RICK|nr:exported hypothetical protein [Candidatus Xenohaliotis californiensis]
MVLRLFVLCCVLITSVSGCSSFNGEDQDALYKKIFSQKRRPVYNPGGIKFSLQKDFYNAYMQKNKGIIPPIKNQNSTTLKNNQGKSNGNINASMDGNVPLDGMRLIDAITANKKYMTKHVKPHPIMTLGKSSISTDNQSFKPNAVTEKKIQQKVLNYDSIKDDIRSGSSFNNDLFKDGTYNNTNTFTERDLDDIANDSADEELAKYPEHKNIKLRERKPVNKNTHSLEQNSNLDEIDNIVRGLYE